MDAELLDDAENRGGGNVIERVFILLFQPLAQILRADVARLAVAEAPARARAKRNECRIRQPENDSLAVHEKLAIHRVAVARGDRIPAMGKAAMVDAIRHLRGHIESADELAHLA